jgi:hypothetical protein
MDDLTPSQLNALQNLSRRKTGEEGPFVNISAARALTELGLAERSREGWDITPAGAALLARLTPLGPEDGDAAPPLSRIGKPPDD